jgi:hypothetical protein
MAEMPMSLWHKELKSSKEEDDRSICRELMTAESRLMWGKQSDVNRSHSALTICGGSGNGAAKFVGKGREGKGREEEGVKRKYVIENDF